MGTSSTSASFRRRHAPALTAGVVLQNRYCVVRELGAGGMGAVYEAIDQRLGARVALKETFSINERLRRQFEQEARLLAQLHHPSLPRVSDYFTEDGRALLVMQFIGGDDLAEVIAKEQTPFLKNQVIAWADQLLDALIYLHTRERQIIHRDIKPHNLKLTESGHIALLDFGLAKTDLPDQSTTQSSHSIFGYTRRYSPLEQMKDEGTSPQSDIYALGATLYHLLSGTKPPDALVRARSLANQKTDPLQPVNELNPAAGLEIAAILERAMALNAADRFENAIEFRDALRQVGRERIERESDSRNSSTGGAIQNSTGGRHAGSKIDPFDSYSILRPENEFSVPAKRRLPAFALMILAIAMITAVAAFPSKIIDSLAHLTGDARMSVITSTNRDTTVRQTKNEVVASKTPARTGPSTPSSPTSQQTEAPKRKTRRNQPKPNTPKPPQFSLVP